MYSKSDNQKKAYLFAMVAVLFWSTMSSAFKITLRYVSFDSLLFWSSLSGVLALVILNLRSSNRFSRLKRKHILSSAIMGLFNPFLYYIILFKAYELLEAQIAGTLNYFWPIALVLLSIPFLGQKIKMVSIIAVFISFFGIVIISTGGSISQFQFANPIGIALAVGSAFFWATYWILNMKDEREETGKILLNLIFGFLYILIYLLIVHGKVEVPNLYGLMGSFYIGLFEMSITFVIWLKALQLSSDTARVSNLVYLSPFIALVFIHIFVGEQIHLSTVLGLLIVIIGIIIQQFSARSDKKS